MERIFPGNAVGTRSKIVYPILLPVRKFNVRRFLIPPQIQKVSLRAAGIEVRCALLSETQIALPFERRNESDNGIPESPRYIEMIFKGSMIRF